jgi:hypothetical protein
VSRIKRLLEEAEQRRFLPTGSTVCRKHVEDQFLLGQLAGSPVPSPCVVCGRTAVEHVDVDKICDVVVAVIETYRRRAIDELYHDEETDSGYALADPYLEDTADVVDTYFEGAFDDDLMEYVRVTLDPEWWFDPGVIWLEGVELYLHSWNWFRALFRSANVELTNLLAGELDGPRRAGQPADGILPSEILPKLWGLVDELEVVRVIPASHEWIRAVHVPIGEPLGASCLGTAPSTSSTENRMNRAGEPMFYGTADEETAVIEIGEPQGDRETAFGTWVPSRSLRVLDLDQIPILPDLYDVERAGLRWRLVFLSDFAADVSQPVGGHEQVEYRATQIFMDFLRSRALGLDGIIYRSARTGRPCCALDVDNAHCLEADATIGAHRGDLRLELIRCRIRP